MKGSSLAAAAIAAALFTALAVATGPAAAQTPPAPPASTPAAPAILGMPEVIELLRQRGYTDIREIERKGPRLYEVDARDPAGRRVEIVIDARSGEVLRSKRDY